ncbi:hypothetical protein V1291_004862 [Nitrobacteraceae bacterium AZCC 1564]
MHAHLDNFILGSAAGLISLVTALCIAHYFNLGSMQQMVDSLMP